MTTLGRKNKYYTHVQPRLEEIGYWCREGLIEAEICKRLDITVASLANYKNEFMDLFEVLKDGKAIADYRVENSLYQRAMGMDVEETTEEPVDGVMVVTKRLKKKLAPDPVSMIFWLKNRKPEQWRDKQEIGGNITINYSVPVNPADE